MSILKLTSVVQIHPDSLKNILKAIQGYINQIGFNLTPNQKQTVYRIALGWSSFRPAPHLINSGGQVSPTVNEAAGGGAEWDIETPYHREWLALASKREDAECPIFRCRVCLGC